MDLRAQSIHTLEGIALFMVLFACVFVPGTGYQQKPYGTQQPYAQEAYPVEQVRKSKYIGIIYSGST